MTISDLFIVLATLLSPLIAVQVQKLIELATEQRSAKKQIFQSLMATRATRLAPEHVQALNMIDLEFGASNWRGHRAKDKHVVDRWRIYADHLGSLESKPSEARLEAWIEKNDELFTDLLEALAHALGYKFDRVQLRRGIYRPQAHNTIEMRQENIGRALEDVLMGRTPLKMTVIASDEVVDLQRKLQEGVLKAVEGGAVKIRTIEPSSSDQRLS